MSGKEILVDTNILLYLLKGSDALQELLQGKILYISFITELELIGFPKMSDQESEEVATLLLDCTIVSLNAAIKMNYVSLRKSTGLKLGDAIIAATASALRIPLITADKRFKLIDDIDLIRYEP